MCEGSATPTPNEQSVIDPTYARTREKLILKYRGYLAGTVDTNGETLPEWRIENRQIKLEAQGISAASAPSRASEAIARTREKYLQAFLADGNSPVMAQKRYKTKTKGVLEQRSRACRSVSDIFLVSLAVSTNFWTTQTFV